MELKLSWFLQNMKPNMFYFPLLTTITICLLSISLYIVLNTKLKYLLFWCNCEICEKYINMTWTKEFNNLCDWYAHLLNNSSTKTIHIHVLGNVITSNPNNVEYLLKTKFQNYPKGKPFSTILGDFLGRGIFNVDGERWKFQLKMASLELGKSTVRSYAFFIIRREIEHRLIPLFLSLSSRTSQGRETALDLQDVFRRFSFDVICRFSFGIDPRCLEISLPISDFAEAFDLASKLSAERAMAVSPLVWKIKRKLNLGSEKKMKEAIKLINLLAHEVIRQRRKLGFWNRKDLLSRFMCTVDDETYLRDIVISFLLAGRDTVASALTSLFLLLAKHSHVCEAIRVEVDRVLGPGSNLTGFDQIQNLHYLQATIHESMRLYPPIQFDSKFCQENDYLPDGTFIKKGTRVTYHPYAMGRSEEIWGSDCFEFKPDRWLRDGLFYPENTFKYPVFQAGYRVCLGKEMALVELYSVALTLVRRFDIVLAATDQSDRVLPHFSPGLTATFCGGLPVMIREREDTVNLNK